MNYPARLFGLSVVLLACTAPLLAQSANKSKVVAVFAVLSTPVDTKTSARGDEVLMSTVNDVIIDGKVIVPKGSKLVGHIGGVISKGKDDPKSVIAIAIDKAVSNGTELSVQAIVAAVAAPGVRSVNPSNSTASSPRSDPGPAVAVDRARGERPGDQPFALTAESQGAYGFDDVAISWHLTMPPPLTIFATKAKRLRLETGTQLLLRMFPPGSQ